MYRINLIDTKSMVTLLSTVQTVLSIPILPMALNLGDFWGLYHTGTRQWIVTTRRSQPNSQLEISSQSGNYRFLMNPRWEVGLNLTAAAFRRPSFQPSQERDVAILCPCLWKGRRNNLEEHQRFLLEVSGMLLYLHLHLYIFS